MKWFDFPLKHIYFNLVARKQTTYLKGFKMASLLLEGPFCTCCHISKIRPTHLYV